MSNQYALSKIESELQQVYCDRRSLEILGTEINHRKWHADLLDDEGDPCGRMLLGVDSALPAHATMRWTCQLGIHFGSTRWQDGVMGCGSGDTPQEAYEAACAFFERFGCTGQAHYFWSINHE
jgi:hypothetical protein